MHTPHAHGAGRDTDNEIRALRKIVNHFSTYSIVVDQKTGTAYAEDPDVAEDDLLEALDEYCTLQNINSAALQNIRTAVQRQLMLRLNEAKSRQRNFSVLLTDSTMIGRGISYFREMIKTFLNGADDERVIQKRLSDIRDATFDCLELGLLTSALTELDTADVD